MLLLAAVAAVSTGQVASAEPDCAADVELVVARGTTEPGRLGAAIGDPLAATLGDLLGGPVAAYPVNYPASLLDPMSVGRGSADLVRHIVDTARACPQQRFIVAGYSQGAVVVHTALGADVASAVPGSVHLPAEFTDRIQAVLLFGDPFRLLGGGALDGPWRLGSWCANGDPVCQVGGFQWTAHVAYGDAVTAGARFAASAL